MLVTTILWLIEKYSLSKRRELAPIDSRNLKQSLLKLETTKRIRAL